MSNDTLKKYELEELTNFPIIVMWTHNKSAGSGSQKSTSLAHTRAAVSLGIKMMSSRQPCFLGCGHWDTWNADPQDKRRKDWDEAESNTYKIINTLGTPMNDMHLHYKQDEYTQNMKDKAHHDCCAIVRAMKTTLIKNVEDYLDLLDVFTIALPGKPILWHWSDTEYKKHASR